MNWDRETNWSSSLLTATSFIGLVISVVFGLIASLSAGNGEFECVVLGTACAATFATHLRPL